jgi:hypothetical protein
MELSIPEINSQIEAENKPFSWSKDIPATRMRAPKSWGDRMKYVYWKLYTPIHPYVRDLALSARVVRHEGRQEYLIGTLRPDTSLEAFVAFLISKGYGNHFIAWKDDDELISMRYSEDFKTQYHLRIFSDGEVRGHFEFTPEYRPYRHLKKIGQEDRREYFIELLKEWIHPTAK